ncbi:MAG TPA: thiamine phosphate synthase [Candidatus Dormibacteraeota bacterium]|nr:thiamine phosphate synthase [Candidatus Dormibacteraeota bacterium]
MKLVFPRLYAIIDSTLLTGSELVLAETLAGSGVELVQYRNKTASSRENFEISRQLSAILGARGVRFIVNDRPDIALLAGAGGVHVGQEDLGVEESRAVCGGAIAGRNLKNDFWVGVSTHTLEQVAAANLTSADYIAFGPVFPTTTKKNPDAVVGTELLRRARQLTAKPLVAIGGITLERAAQVYRAGADSLAVVRDLIAAPDPGARARAFIEVAASAASRSAG